jgi:hypothetical protein
MHILLAPVLITPTKPLTPSHVKGLLWLDTLYRTTSRIQQVTQLNNRRPFDITIQTVGFWAYLDSNFPNKDYTAVTEQWIGEQYIQFHLEYNQIEWEKIAEYRQHVEEDGWIHPSSKRILNIWQEYYKLLNINTDWLWENTPLVYSVDDVIEKLNNAGCLLDLRKMGGPIYIDFTQDGIPLRQIMDNNGIENYLLCILRELLHHTSNYNKIILLCDEDIMFDYLILAKVLNQFGVEVLRFSIGRVSLDGKILSSRYGGWQNYTFDNFIDQYLYRYSKEVFQVGARLYFIAYLGKISKQPFSFSHIDNCMKKAARLLEEAPPPQPSDEYDNFLRKIATPNGYIYPYRFIVQLYSTFMTLKILWKNN